MISLLLGAVVIMLSWLYKNSDYGMRLMIHIGAVSSLLFIAFLIYSLIALILATWKKNLPLRGISSAFVIYFGFLIWAASYQPLLVAKLSENWDFRLASLGLAIVALGISFVRRD